MSTAHSNRRAANLEQFIQCHCSIIPNLTARPTSPMMLAGAVTSNFKAPWGITAGADPQFLDGGFVRTKRAEIFGHHAHFTCLFHMRELRARVLTYIIQRDIDARDWTDS